MDTFLNYQKEYLLLQRKPVDTKDINDLFLRFIQCFMDQQISASNFLFFLEPPKCQILPRNHRFKKWLADFRFVLRSNVAARIRPTRKGVFYKISVFFLNLKISVRYFFLVFLHRIDKQWRRFFHIRHKEYDVAITLSHRKDHNEYFDQIGEKLSKKGYSVIFFNILNVIGENRFRSKTKIPTRHYSSFRAYIRDPIKSQFALEMTDFTAGTRNWLAFLYYEKGIQPVVLQEMSPFFHQINDFYMLDYVIYLTPGLSQSFGKQFVVVGNPFINDVFHRPFSKIFPHIPLIVVNVNFAYEVGEEFFDIFIWPIMAVLKELNEEKGITFAFNLHPVFLETVPKELLPYVSHLPILEDIKRASLVISRVSTVIPTALALKTPVVFFANTEYHLTKIFNDSMGAFSIAWTRSQLKEAILMELSEKFSVRERSLKFLDSHFCVQSIPSAVEKATEVLASLIEEKRKSL